MLPTRCVESVYQSRTPEFIFQTSSHGDPMKRLLLMLISGGLLTAGLMLWAPQVESLPQPFATIYLFALTNHRYLFMARETIFEEFENQTPERRRNGKRCFWIYVVVSIFLLFYFS